MEALARGALGGLPVTRLWIRAIQPGRTAYVVVHVLVPPGTDLDLAAADRLRGAVIAALTARHAPVVVDVVFTAVEAYAAPTAYSTDEEAALRLQHQRSVGRLRRLRVPGTRGRRGAERGCQSRHEQD